MRGLNAKNLAVYRVNKFYIKKTKITETLLSYICFCNYHYLYIKIPMISTSHRSPDNLLPSNQLLTYPKTYLDMCSQLYSVSLIKFGPTTQNNQPWLGGSKLHSNL